MNLRLTSVMMLWCLALSSPVWAVDPLLKINVTVKDAAELYAGEPPIVGSMTVVARILNVSTGTVSFTTGCGSLCWGTDTPSIALAPATVRKKNTVSVMTLEPRNFHDATLTLILSSETAPGDLHFKISYRPQSAPAGMSVSSGDLSGFLTEQSPYWSDEVTVPTHLASDEKQRAWHAKSKWLDDIKTQDSTPAKDGVIKRAYPDGKPYDERDFKNGKPTGTWKEYDANGQLRKESHFKDGKRDGTLEEYASGKLAKKEIWNDGVLISYVTYNADGSIHGDMKFRTKIKGMFVPLGIPCAESDSDKEVLSMDFPRCDH